VLVEDHEEVCLEARRHGIVLARPLLWAGLLGSLGGALATVSVPGAPIVGLAIVAFAAAVALRAVWRWERTRVVVTTEKVFVVNGTWRRKARAVRLKAVEAVEFEQTVVGQLLGYGTVVVGPLALEKIPRPKRLYHLLDRLAG
jgi:Bacterial PH domain